MEIIRAKAFKVRVSSDISQQSLKGGAQTSTSFHRLDDANDKVLHSSVSCWNCDGELIDEPNIDVRYASIGIIGQAIISKRYYNKTLDKM